MKKIILLSGFVISLLSSTNLFGQWAQMSPGLTASHEGSKQREGAEVAISADGMTMASLCAYYHGGDTTSPVIIYRRNGLQWQKQEVIYANLEDDGGNYRSCIALSANGNTLAVNNSLLGWLAIYIYDGSSWRLQGKLPCRHGYGGGFASYRGIAISYDGNTVLCNGQVIVRVNGTWILQQNLLPVDRPIPSTPGFVGYTDTANHFSVYTSSALSADGNTAVVCDNYGPDTTFNLWIFIRNGNTWTQQGSRLEGSHHEIFSNSGIVTAPHISISGDGNTVALCASSYAGWGIWVFKRNGNAWTEQTPLPLGEQQYLTIGRHVDLSYDGNSFITANGYGIFYYRNNSGNWTRIGTHSTYISDGPYNNNGRAISSLAMDSSGSHAITGSAYYRYGMGQNYYFTRLDTIWSQTGAGISDSIDAGGSYFGFKTVISADGSTIAGGGYMDAGNKGAVWVYQRSGSVWAQFGSKLWIHDQYYQARWYGYSLALSGDGSTLAVGAPNSNNFTGSTFGGSGSIYVYIRSGNNYVLQGDSLIVPQVHGLGLSISISADGNTLVASSIDSGTVLFTRNGGIWNKQRTFSGNSSPVISGDGNTIAIGDISANNSIGGVSVYYRSGNNWVLQGNAIKPASLNVSGYYFPRALSISTNGNYVAASSTYLNSSKGEIFCYVRNGSIWSVRDSVKPSTPGNNYQHGFGVCISATGDTICEVQSGGTYNSSNINVFSRVSGHWVLAKSMPSAPMEYYYRHFGSIDATPDARYIAVGIPQNVNNIDGEIRVFKSSALLDSLVLKKDATCAQVPNGKIIIKLTGGLQPYKYVWSNSGPNVDSIVNLPPGNYSLTITDNSGDTLVRNYVIASKFLPTRSGYSYSFNCSTGLGTIQVSSTHGTAPYTYLWNVIPVQQTNTAINLHPGFYTYLAIDSNGCSYNDSASVPATPYSINISGTQPQCGNNGTVIATMPGGTSPFTYGWSNFASTSVVNGLGTGTYTVTITDGNNCIVTGSYTLISSCNSVIKGNVFFDHNGNCQFDALQDHNLPNATIVAQHNGYNVYGSTDAIGNYSIITADSGAFSVSVGSLLGCNVLLCGGHNYPLPVTIQHAGDTVSNVDLEIDVHNYNLWLQAVTGNQPYPGSSFDLTLYYGDLVDSVVPNGTITVSYDSLLVFNNSSPSYTTHDAVNHLITWNVSNISLYNTQNVTLHFTAPASDPLHSQTVVNASITPAIGDCNLYNNNIAVPIFIAGSLDPNYKEVSPANVLLPDDSIVTYTIHFQNTGTDSTHFVEIIDTLSDYVDAGSIRTVATSHYPYTFSISGKGILDWKFNPLALPDSGTDFTNSQGFITYQVYVRKNLPIGTQVKNTASIYFDYNVPVRTNTTVNTLSLVTGLANTVTSDVNVIVFPNPFSTSTRFNISGNIEKYDITIKDVLGRSVAEFSNLFGTTFTFNRSNIPAGCYLYNLITKDRTIARGKLVIE